MNSIICMINNILKTVHLSYHLPIISNHTELADYTISEVEIKIAMFADDTQLFHSSEASISESFDVLENYCQA